MKPTSPDQKEIDALGAEVSAAYRPTADAEPSAHVDAAILDAARREASRPRRRSWQVPAAVAAVLVLGVSLSLRMRDDYGGLPATDVMRGNPAGLAKPAAPSLEARAPESVPVPAAKPKVDVQSRPSRERMARTDREADVRTAPEALANHPALSDQADALSQAPAVAEPDRQAYVAADALPAPAPAAPAPRALEQLQSQDAANALERKKESADAATERRELSLRKQAQPAAGAVAQRGAQDWMQEIEGLLREGKKDQARERFAEFRRHYPQQPVPEALKALDRELEAGR